MKEIQTHFLTTISPAHRGDQEFLHQDHHLHLADLTENIVSPKPLYQQNHEPLVGQTTINDFMLQKKPGW